MRKTINPQPNLREPWLELEHARELETISSLLDAHPKLNELVLQDLRSVTPPAGSDVGRGGMSAEQVLRALLVKQLNQFSYRELAFHLADSRSYRTFCQLGIIEPTPSKSTLAANIKAVKFETLEQINRELVSVAEDAGIEKGRKVRVDCTVVESNIHPPTDSELLYDCVRVLTRLMCGARELLGTVVVFGNRTRRAKRRRLGVALLHGPEQIADLPVPVAESPGAVRIGHPERSHLVEYLAPNSVFNSLPRQRSSPHLRPDDRLVTIDRVLHHASLGVA